MSYLDELEKDLGVLLGDLTAVTRKADDLEPENPQLVRSLIDIKDHVRRMILAAAGAANVEKNRPGPSKRDRFLVEEALSHGLHVEALKASGQWETLVQDIIRQAGPQRAEPWVAPPFDYETQQFIDDHGRNCPDVESGDMEAEEASSYLVDLLHDYARLAVEADRGALTVVGKPAESEPITLMNLPTSPGSVGTGWYWVADGVLGWAEDGILRVKLDRKDEPAKYDRVIGAWGERIARELMAEVEEEPKKDTAKDILERANQAVTEARAEGATSHNAAEPWHCFDCHFPKSPFCLSHCTEAARRAGIRGRQDVGVPQRPLVHFSANLWSGAFGTVIAAACHGKSGDGFPCSEIPAEVTCPACIAKFGT